jgi:hypothetical protein
MNGVTAFAVGWGKEAWTKQYGWWLGPGALLIAGGALFLLANLGLWAGLISLFWLVCLGAAGSGLLLAYQADRTGGGGC